MALEIHVLSCDRHANATGLNRLMGSQTLALTQGLNKAEYNEVKSDYNKNNKELNTMGKYFSS
jgi:hypothetical protein